MVDAIEILPYFAAGAALLLGGIIFAGVLGKSEKGLKGQVENAKSKLTKKAKKKAKILDRDVKDTVNKVKDSVSDTVKAVTSKAERKIRDSSLVNTHKANNETEVEENDSDDNGFTVSLSGNQNKGNFFALLAENGDAERKAKPATKVAAKKAESSISKNVTEATVNAPPLPAPAKPLPAGPIPKTVTPSGIMTPSFPTNVGSGMGSKSQSPVKEKPLPASKNAAAPLGNLAKKQTDNAKMDTNSEVHDDQIQNYFGTETKSPADDNWVTVGEGRSRNVSQETQNFHAEKELTKKQKKNQRKAEKLRQVKQSDENDRVDRLQDHKKTLVAARIADLPKKSYPANASGWTHQSAFEILANHDDDDNLWNT